MMSLDEDNMVPDKNKSVFEGAISGWDRQNPFFFRQLEAVACTMAKHKQENEILFSSHYSCPIYGY